jgi:hypothetical protein
MAMPAKYKTPLYLQLAEIALLATVLAAPILFMVCAP